jgi:hypothetical protein
VTTPDFIMFGAGTDEAFEAEMQIAEVAQIMHLLPDQAREALLTEARLVARATLPAGTSMDPFGKATPKMPGDRRQVDISVPTDRRKH